jgi:hypothetical protein
MSSLGADRKYRGCAELMEVETFGDLVRGKTAFRA